MRNSYSLPSLLQENRLFISEQELEQAKSEFKSRLQFDATKNPTEQVKPPRSMIHFQQNVEGFASFRSINSSKSSQILQALKTMRTRKTNLGHSVKAQIIFNKNQYAKITDYCQYRRNSQKEIAINKLAKLQPLPMKKQVKKIEKTKKKTKTTVGIKTALNYQIYEINRICWKPFIDFDAMAVPIGHRVYFIGGRKIVPMTFYDRKQDKWIETEVIANLKPFGESDATVLSQSEILFFGGSRFLVMGESEPTNVLTYVNIETKTAKTETFSQQKVPSRFFHAQCQYGNFLLISGGINKENKLYNNFMAYHLEKKYWFQLTIDKMAEKLREGFAKHKMMAIFHKRKQYQIYENSENNPIIASDQEKKQIKEEGIYIFGGEDANVELSNKLYILKLGSSKLEISEPQIKGQPPHARKNFGWIRIRQFLFIHGGRNDELRPWVLGNLHVLNLKIMEWLWVTGDKPALRHSHALLPYQDEIIIIGGKNIQGLCKQIYPIKFQEVIEFV